MSEELHDQVDEAAAANDDDADTVSNPAVDDDAPTQQWSAVGDAAPSEESEPEAAAEEAADDEPDPLVEVMAERDAALAEAADWKARAYRATADLDNVRKRFGKEREELRKYAAENLLKDLLPVIDNLERAVGHAEANGPEGLVDGVQMVLRQFNSTLKTKGAESFDALGQPFDPQIHEAMTEMPTAEYEPGHVASVFQRGWRLNGRLVRPAMVVVAKAPPAPEEGA